MNLHEGFISFRRIGCKLNRNGQVLNKKHFFVVVFFTLILLSLALVESVHLDMAQVGSNVSGVISQDTIWTPAGSPYNLTGVVTVNEGVILTVDAGVTLNLNSYEIQVNGTFAALGTLANTIQVNKELGAVGLTFNPSSISWNAQKRTGCVVKGVVGSGWIIAVDDTSPLINENLGVDVDVSGGSPIISFNTFSVAMGPYIDVEGGSPTISNNDVGGYTGTGGGGGFVPDFFLDGSNSAIVSDNTFVGVFDPGAIVASSGAPVIEMNVITSDQSPSNASGFGITVYDADPLIENNTISQIAIGLNIYYDSKGNPPAIPPSSPPSPMITGNNVENNSLYNVYLGSYPYVSGLIAPNITASNNWWGTADVQTINQSIHDFKDNPNLGNVTFIPFLTSPNLEAEPEISSAPVQTPTTSPAPTSSLSPSPTATAIPHLSLMPPTSTASSLTPTASVPELSVWVPPPLIAATAAILFIILRRRTKSRISNRI